MHCVLVPLPTRPSSSLPPHATPRHATPLIVLESDPARLCTPSPHLVPSHPHPPAPIRAHPHPPQIKLKEGGEDEMALPDLNACNQETDVPDICALTYLNEAAVLATIQARWLSSRVPAQSLHTTAALSPAPLSALSARRIPTQAPSFPIPQSTDRRIVSQSGTSTRGLRASSSPSIPLSGGPTCTGRNSWPSMQSWTRAVRLPTSTLSGRPLIGSSSKRVRGSCWECVGARDGAGRE